MALTDWGNTSDLNQGGFKDGVFQGSQSQLLPWPENTRPNFAPSLFLGGGLIIPNPYDEAKGYVSITFDSVNYYNSDGTIKWTVSRYDIYNGDAIFSFQRDSRAHIVHMIDGVPHLFGYGYCSQGKCFFSINLESVEITRGSWLDYIHVRFSISEDGQLFSICKDTRGVHKCFIIDNLTLAGEIEGCGYINNMRFRGSSNADQFRALTGISLLRGSLILCSADGVDTYNSKTNNRNLFFGINANCDFSRSSNKTLIKTEHSHAINAFHGIVQISKDLFMSSRDIPFYYEYIHQTNTLFFTRKQLEDWASDVIYSAHDIRIPKQA